MQKRVRSTSLLFLTLTAGNLVDAQTALAMGSDVIAQPGAQTA